MEDQKNTAWLQISAGQGPKECGWVVAQLYKKMAQEAINNNLMMDCVESTAFDKILRNQDLITPDSYRSVLLRLEGQSAGAFSQQWIGTIKWQGQSHYRPKHKRTNWFVGIQPVSINTSKVKSITHLIHEVNIQTTKARGPGGQHVNKTSSAIRLTHPPSGICIRMESERSQHRNKRLALEKLQLMLAQDINMQEIQDIHERWLNHYQVKKGSPIKTFSGPMFANKKSEGPLNSHQLKQLRRKS